MCIIVVTIDAPPPPLLKHGILHGRPLAFLNTNKQTYDACLLTISSSGFSRGVQGACVIFLEKKGFGMSFLDGCHPGAARGDTNRQFEWAC